MVIIKDECIGCIIWLLCAVTIAASGFWYPEYVANRNESPDDRFGWVLMSAMPFYILGGAIAVRTMLLLLRVRRKQNGLINHALLALGGLMTAFALTPLLIIGKRIFLR